VLGVLLAGCYELQPVSGSTPQPGQKVAFDVTDVGRVALGGSMGPEISQVEGNLIQRENGDYLLGVTSVSLLRGGVQTWKGEQVRLKPEYVGNVYERRLDKGKTFVAAALGAGIAVGVMSQGLLGSSGSDEPTNPKDTAQLQRSPKKFRLTILSLPLPHLGRF
jgi:hypothetical protein